MSNEGACCCMIAAADMSRISDPCRAPLRLGTRYWITLKTFLSSDLARPVAGGVLHLSVDSACAFAVSVNSIGSAIMQQIGPANDSLQSTELAGIMPLQCPAADTANSAVDEACQVTSPVHAMP